MSLLAKLLILILMGTLGILPCLYLFIGMPAVLIWKFYRKAKYNISIWD